MKTLKTLLVAAALWAAAPPGARAESPAKASHGGKGLEELAEAGKEAATKAVDFRRLQERLKIEATDEKALLDLIRLATEGSEMRRATTVRTEEEP